MTTRTFVHYTTPIKQNKVGDVVQMVGFSNRVWEVEEFNRRMAKLKPIAGGASQWFGLNTPVKKEDKKK